MKEKYSYPFRSQLAFDIFNSKYRHDGCETWDDLVNTLVDDVCIVPGGPCMNKDDRDQLKLFMREMKFIPGGRYLYYAGRPTKFFNNCYLLRSEEDTREDWADLSKRSESCLLTGGGIGNNYSIYRASGSTIKRTGGVASGPIPKMYMVNEIGRNVIQGGSRRSAIYASLDWTHGDVWEFLKCKDWKNIEVVPGLSHFQAKQQNFNHHAPLDMTNISVNYNTDWYMNFLKTGDVGEVFLENVKNALSTGEPGFSFNFFEKENETLRNACTEVTSEDDSDVCNLGSVNLSRISSISDFADVVNLGTQFLLFGTLRAELPYDKIYTVRIKNRRLGLGLMGVHEWLIKKGYRYECPKELRDWLSVYAGVSSHISKTTSDYLGISRPVANRAIAPTGTIGLIAGTTTGIEPVYAVSYKRRYLSGSSRWKYQFAVDHTAQTLIQEGISPDRIESSINLAHDYERRISVQADIQDYVDMGISSTINLPPGDTGIDVKEFAGVLARYSNRLRGFTCYPDGARGGQPLTSVPYEEVKDKLGDEFEENKEVVTEWNDQCLGGVCGI